ncbi:MAG: hypothetical protein J6V30_03110 [Paludibacteraceae bacterium]|nr:hypothetical protein [Paludibacteraceae bacterium]
MKLAIKGILAFASLILVWMCFDGVSTPIKFEQTKNDREKQIIEGLVNIRKAEVEYKNQFGVYTANFDTLIAFVKEGKMKQVLKEGTLSDMQLEKGLTEEKALEIVKRGNAKEIAENGLQGFRRDTAFVDVLPSLFGENFDANQLRYVPFTDNKEYELAIGSIEKNGIKLPLFEAKVPYDWYLGDLDRQELVNLKDVQEKLGRYAGLMVGNVNEPNNNAGNWEE